MGYELETCQISDQLKLPFALQNRETVGQLIEQRTGIRLRTSID